MKLLKSQRFVEAYGSDIVLPHVQVKRFYLLIFVGKVDNMLHHLARQPMFAVFFLPRYTNSITAAFFVATAK